MCRSLFILKNLELNLIFYFILFKFYFNGNNLKEFEKNVYLVSVEVEFFGYRC